MVVVGTLYQVHHQLVGKWFAFSHFINYEHDFVGLVAGGHGKLAEGPEPIISAYQQVMQQYGFTTSCWKSQARVRPGQLVALRVGDCQIVAARVEAHRLLEDEDVTRTL